MVCKNCGNPLRETAKFCMKCGTKVEVQSEAFQRMDIQIDPNIDKELLYKRVFMYIEDGKKNEAFTYLEWMLDHDPEDARAYLGKLLLDLNIEFEEDLAKVDQDISENKNYRRAYKYGDDAMKKRLDDYSISIQENVINKGLTGLSVKELYLIRNKEEYANKKDYIEKLISEKSEAEYLKGKSYMSDLSISLNRNSAISIFTELGDYKDSAELLAIIIGDEKERKYERALEFKNQASKGVRTVFNIQQAEALFDELGDYKDSQKYLNVCRKMLSNVNQ